MTHWMAAAIAACVCVACAAHHTSRDAGGDAACPAGRADCDGDGTCEADLAASTSCGACGSVCAAEQRCVAGRCEVLDAGATDPDAAPDAAACGARWPARPAPEDTPDASPVVFVLRDLRMDPTTPWAQLGWDLDQQCTTGGIEPRCTPPGASEPPTDGDDGRDSVFGATVLSELVADAPELPDQVRGRMNAGEAILLHIDGWNGEPDDPLVSVWLAQTAGVERPDGATEPRWDGSDVWNVSRANFVTMAERPRLQDDRAYIAGRQLVMRLPDRERLVFPFGADAQLELRLTEARLVGTISEDLRHLEDVVLTGRVALIDLDPTLTKAGVCAGTALRERIDALASRVSDLRSDPGTVGPGATCDALSVALPMEGVRTALGAVVDPPPPPPDPCAAE